MTRTIYCYNIVITMVQKLIQIGNSQGVVIPSHIRKQLGLKKGSSVVVEQVPGREAIVLRKAGKRKKISRSSVVDREFKKWLDNVLVEDAEILDELAVR